MNKVIDTSMTLLIWWLILLLARELAWRIL